MQRFYAGLAIWDVEGAAHFRRAPARRALSRPRRPIRMARTANDMRQRSKNVTEGPERAPHRAMLRATGLRDDDLKKPLVGVASSWNEVTPCNLHLDVDAKDVKAGVRTAGGTPDQFSTIGVSDARAVGREGRKASRVSREDGADWGPGRAAACLPPTRCRPALRRSGCPCPEPRRSPPSTPGAPRCAASPARP